MLEEIWSKLGDGDISSRCDVRRYKVGKEHFKLNSYNKMRVFLAVQIPSQTTIKMVNDYCELPDGGKKEDYAGMLELFEKVDRLVDIINVTKRERRVEYISCPRHKHVYELFSILQLFEEWKKEAGGLTKKYITRETYEDLKWMVFGLAGLACTYLKDDNSLKLHQGRSGSDVCEHFFAKIRQINTNPTMQQCREITSKISGLKTGSGHLFQFSSGANTAGQKRDHHEYFEELQRQPKKSKK